MAAILGYGMEQSVLSHTPPVNQSSYCFIFLTEFQQFFQNRIVLNWQRVDVSFTQFTFPDHFLIFRHDCLSLLFSYLYVCHQLLISLAKLHLLFFHNPNTVYDLVLRNSFAFHHTITPQRLISLLALSINSQFDIDGQLSYGLWGVLNVFLYL